MVSRFAAKDAVLMLYANHVDSVDVQEVCGAAVGSDVALGDLEAHARRIRVTLARIVHREDEAIDLREPARKRIAEIGGESGNPALPRNVVADHRNLANGVWLADDSSSRARRLKAVRAAATPDDRNHRVRSMVARGPRRTPDAL